MSWRTTRASAQTGEPVRHTAVIDLGSNSWRLVVFSYGGAEARADRTGAEARADRTGDGAGSPARPTAGESAETPAPRMWWKRTDELYESVRIAEGMGDSGALQEPAITRGLETLAVFERFCRASRLADEDVHAIATSAIRDATNRSEFLERAAAVSSFPIEVLSAEAEAHYGYVAAVNTSTLTDGVVLDIGGGSLQLVEVTGRRQRRVISFPLGAVRMTERFLPGSGPARKKDLQKLRAHVRESIGALPWLADRHGRLVGAGGAVRNLAAAAGHAALGPSGGIDIGVQGYVVTRRALSDLVGQLASLPAAERAEVEGIKPGRADIILAAAVTLETVLECGEFDGIETTEAGLRDGLFLARTLLGEDRPLFGDVREAAVRNLAVQYESDVQHTEHVARLALQMHESLAGSDLFSPEPGERELLWAAGMLHDVGMTISYDDHHKHSRYLIVSAELPGFDPRERALIAQMTRYHRKGAPKLGQWSKLGRPGDEQMLDRCAVILRLAEHLERGRDQSVSQATLRTNGDGVALHLHAAGDLTLPRWSVERYGDDEAFEKVFHRPLVIG